MEPFGLFQFLQNLLNTEPPATPKEEPTQNQTPDAEPTPPPSVPNPAAQFLEQHEKRAGRR